MRKVLLAGVAAVFGLGISSAMADVTVEALIKKTKTITIVEDLDVFKDVILTVNVISEPDKFAESVTLVNQSNERNEGCGNCAEKTDTLFESGNDNSGILSINEASGNMTNQANAISAAVDTRTVGGGGGGPPAVNTNAGFAESQAAVSQDNNNSIVRTVNLLFRDAEIENSLSNNTGIIFVNVGTGNMSNQANALSLAVSFALEGVALAEADLGQFNTFNKVFESDSVGVPPAEFGINKAVLLTNSINNNAGIVGVNVTTGNFANQGNVVSFSAVQI